MWIQNSIIRRFAVAAAKALAGEAIRAYFERVIAESGTVTVDSVIADINARFDAPLLSEDQEAAALRLLLAPAIGEVIAWWVENRPADAPGGEVGLLGGNPEDPTDDSPRWNVAARTADVLAANPDLAAQVAAADKEGAVNA